jgi:hypothetical protein
MNRTIAIILAAAAAGILATAGSATPRCGDLHVTKECSQYNGAAGSFCTITSSNISAIKPGMRVVYLRALSGFVLNTDLVLSSEHGSAGSGHVVLNLATRHGRVTFEGGTGRFAGFEADVDVSLDASGVWHWDGTYSFTPPGED